MKLLRKKTSADDRYEYFMQYLATIWLGLVGFNDPMAESVAGAISDLAALGVKIIILTGDQGMTTIAMLENLGVRKIETRQYSTDSNSSSKDFEFTECSVTSRRSIIPKVPLLLCRVDPHEKVKVVHALQRDGEIVACVDDEVGSSLLAADVSVGIKAKSDIFDLILRNGDFSSLVSAIQEGRRIHRNIRNSIFYFLLTNSLEIIYILMILILKLNVSISQIVFLNVGLKFAVLLSMVQEDEGFYYPPPRRRPRSDFPLSKVIIPPHILAFGFGIPLATMLYKFLFVGRLNRLCNQSICIANEFSPSNGWSTNLDFFNGTKLVSWFGIFGFNKDIRFTVPTDFGIQPEDLVCTLRSNGWCSERHMTYEAGNSARGRALTLIATCSFLTIATMESLLPYTVRKY